MSAIDQVKRERLQRANKLLRTIGSCGRRFFSREWDVSRLELDDRNRIWLWDSYTRKRIYTAYRGRWRHFSQGGTMRDLVMALCQFVRNGTKLPNRTFGPWPETLCNGDLWGYGEDMVTVRKAAIELELIEA